MKKFSIIIIAFFFSQIINAHNPATASYYIFQQDGHWQMRSEFAWSLRNALIKSYPFLIENDGTTDEEYTDCVKDYLDKNLSLSVDGHPLSYESIRQIPGDHGHSFSFILEISGSLNGTQLEVKNKCLTELYQKQKNSMILKINDNKQERILTKKDNNHVFLIE